MRDFDSLEGGDLARYSALMDHQFRIYEDMYFQKQEGHLDLRVWRGFEAPMRDIIAYPGVQAWWHSRSHCFSHDFGTFYQQAGARCCTSGIVSRADREKSVSLAHLAVIPIGVAAV